jgi:hypothetical protein
MKKQPQKKQPQKKKAKDKVKEIRVSVVGVQYRMVPAVRESLVDYLPFRVDIRREEKNYEDPNAIAVWIHDKTIPYNNSKLGYLRRQVAAVWAEEIDTGRLEIEKGYLIELYPEDGVGELLLTVKLSGKASKKSLDVAE